MTQQITHVRYIFSFRTKMTDLLSIHALADKTWNSAPKEIKEEYGEEHIDVFKNTFNIIKYISASNINEVVDCLEDAITAKEPVSVYSPGSLIFKFLFEISPTTILEYVQRIILDKSGKLFASMPSEKRNRYNSYLIKNKTS